METGVFTAGVGAFEIISLVLNLLLGGGLLMTVVTLNSTKKKAAAEAKGAEITNVDVIVKMWQDLAKKMEAQYMTVSDQVERLSKEVNRLRAINSKIVRSLDRITHENMIEMVDKIREEISNDENYHPNFADSPVGRLQKQPTGYPADTG